MNISRSGNTLRAGSAIFHHKTANSKLAPIRRVRYPHKDFKFRPTPVAPFCCATYVSIDKTCPNSCRFKNAGCYVQVDKFMATAMRRLDAAPGASHEVATIEAELIDKAFQRGVPQDGARGGRDLRLHIGGETFSLYAAMELARAASRWLSRGGGNVWTFTHNWVLIPRLAFGAISTLASVETVAEAKLAMKKGYAPAIVVREFPSEKLFSLGGVKFIPCPAETRKRTCVECRLCLDDAALVARKTGIAFASHGKGKAEVDDTLVWIGRRKTM